MLWVILPAYNEAEAIAPLLEKIRHVGEGELGGDYRVLLVNDGSQDDTVARAREALPGPELEVIDRAENRGLAATLAEGLTYAARHAAPEDALVTMDADDTMPPDLIPAMAERMAQGAEVVVASRYVPGAQVVGLSVPRRFLSYMGNLLFRLTLPIPGLRDYTCGYRAVRADLLQRGLELHGDGFFSEKAFSATADVLLKLRPLEPEVAEVPLVLRYDRKATGSKMRVLATIRASLALLVRRRLGRQD
jgi:dolichol-phosphate mannosyltransferase